VKASALPEETRLRRLLLKEMDYGNEKKEDEIL